MRVTGHQADRITVSILSVNRAGHSLRRPCDGSPQSTTRRWDAVALQKKDCIKRTVYANKAAPSAPVCVGGERRDARCQDEPRVRGKASVGLRTPVTPLRGRLRRAGYIFLSTGSCQQQLRADEPVTPLRGRLHRAGYIFLSTGSGEQQLRADEAASETAARGQVSRLHLSVADSPPRRPQAHRRLPERALLPAFTTRGACAGCPALGLPWSLAGRREPRR